MEVSGYLVGSAAFKAVETGDPRLAGSIPVHLRQIKPGQRLRSLNHRRCGQRPPTHTDQVYEMNTGEYIANDSNPEYFALGSALFDDPNTAAIVHRRDRGIGHSRRPELSIDLRTRNSESGTDHRVPGSNLSIRDGRTLHSSREVFGAYRRTVPNRALM